MNLRPREQQFVDGILRGESAAVAARAAGYAASTAKNAAITLMKRPDIATAIEAGRAALSEATEWTAEKIIGRLVELANGAALLNNHSAAVRALEIIAKMTGNLKEKIEIESPSIVTALALAKARAGIPLEAVHVPAIPGSAPAFPPQSPRYADIFDT